jgi:integrase
MQPSKTFKGPERSAVRELARFEQEVHDRISAEKTVGGPTLDEIFELWIVAPARNGRSKSPSTQYQDRNRYMTYLAKRYGKRKAAGITADEIEAFYAELGQAVSAKTGTSLSETTIHRVHELFRAIFYFGKRKKLLTTTPFESVRLAQAPLADPSAPAKSDVMKLLEFLKENDLELFCAVNICAVTGARRSEVVALKFSDVNFSTEELKLTKGLIAVPGRSGLVETKTKTGEVINDGVGIGEDLNEALHNLMISKIGVQGIPDTRIKRSYIFSADATGRRPWHPDTMTSRLRRAQRSLWTASGKMTFKDLRTFVASELVQQPSGLQIARDVLRHKSAETTLRHYLAADKKKNREATRALASELAGARAVSRR